jgi:ubiquilin
MEMARNPELMREMMRNTDRAMSNIESHPEGFNLLRQMYTNVQEPMMNAATQQAQAQLHPTPSQQNPTPTPSPSPNPNTAPLPNPWAPPTPAQTAAQPIFGAGTGTGTGAGAFPSMDFGAGADFGMPAGGDIAALLQNPGIQAMVQQMLSNPELMQQVVPNLLFVSSFISFSFFSFSFSFFFLFSFFSIFIFF